MKRENRKEKQDNVMQNTVKSSETHDTKGLQKFIDYRKMFIYC